MRFTNRIRYLNDADRSLLFLDDGIYKLHAHTRFFFSHFNFTRENEGFPNVSGNGANSLSAPPPTLYIYNRLSYVLHYFEFSSGTNVSVFLDITYNRNEKTCI